jgi:hypothetical protein
LELPVTAGPNKCNEDRRGRGLRIESGVVNGNTPTILRDRGCTSILLAEKLIKRTDVTGGVSDVTLANRYSEKCLEVWYEIDTPCVRCKGQM